MITLKLSAPFYRNLFDKKAEKEGWSLCGVDEVGRGCLAGPVVAAALILKSKSLQKERMPRIDDSKKMTPQERELAYTWLMRNSWNATGIVHHRHIDQTSIYQATLKAMHRAVAQLVLSCPHAPVVILVDAMPLRISWLPNPPEYSDFPGLGRPNTDFTHLLENPQGHVLHFYYGEEKSRAIAAASIIAKVTRDRLMHSLNPLFPNYHLAIHKGYATKLHREALADHGPSIIHRAYFGSVATWHEEHPNDHQLSITTPF